jgi:hypothetical protein
MIGVVLTPGAVGPQDTAFELYSSVEIDPSIQIFGYIDDAYTINWFNGSTLEQGDPSRQMFSFKSTAGGGDTYRVMTTAADTTPGYLSSKIIQGSGVTFTVQNPGANESILVDATGTGYWTRTGTVLSPLNVGDSVEILIQDGGNASALTLTQDDDTNDSHVLEIVQNASSAQDWYDNQAYSIYMRGSGGSSDGFVIFSNDDFVVGNNSAIGNISSLYKSRATGSGNTATVTVEAETTSSGSSKSNIIFHADDDNGGYRNALFDAVTDVDSGKDSGINSSSISSGSGYTRIWADTAASPVNYITVRAKTGTAYGENILITSATGISVDGSYIDLNSTPFTDDNNPIGWSSDGILLSSTEAEWSNIETLIGGEGSIFAAILAAASTGGAGGTLDDAYDYGGSGLGRTIYTSDGAVRMVCAGVDANGALGLERLSGGTYYDEILQIYDDSTLGNNNKAVYIQGDAGGGTTDYQVMGHLIWSAGSMSYGHGDLSDGAGNSRAYTNYRYIDDSGSYASAIMVSEGEASWTTKGYVDVSVNSGGGEVNIYAGGTAGTASGTINITAERYGAMTGADINLVSNDDILIDASELITLESGTAVSFRLYPTGGSGADVRFSDYYIFNNWTNQYIALSDDSTESAQYTTDFGQVSIFEALHQCLSGGGSVSEPDTQIVWGTGTGVDSDSYLTYEDSAHVLSINGRLNLNNASWGTIGSASFATDTITVNYSTGKDIQEVTITADADDLDITAPAGGACKGLVLYIYNSDSSSHTIGGAGNWSDVKWDTSGPDLASETVTIDGTSTFIGSHAILTLIYRGSSWNGWVSYFDGVGA